jgi:hypothetical protein
MALKKDRGKTAWLVTRHWIADGPRWEVAAIFSSRLGGVRVREFVELLDVTSRSYTLSEQFSMMWPRRRHPLKLGETNVPYPAQFGQTKAGLPWEGEIHCGHDPYLRTRRVDELIVPDDVVGQEPRGPTWKERPRP